VVHGKPDFVRGTIAAARRYAIPHEVLDADETMHRVPQFHLRRDVSPADAAAMHRDHLATRLPGLLPQALRSVVCPYTMTPDGDFLVARAPDNNRVLLVSACSGHGFKHSAGLGEAVADSVVTGTPATGLAGFAAGRLAPALVS
jgi:sarcosine oxidase